MIGMFKRVRLMGT